VSSPAGALAEGLRPAHALQGVRKDLRAKQSVKAEPARRRQCAASDRTPAQRAVLRGSRKRSRRRRWLLDLFFFASHCPRRFPCRGPPAKWIGEERHPSSRFAHFMPGKPACSRPTKAGSRASTRRRARRFQSISRLRRKEPAGERLLCSSVTSRRSSRYRWASSQRNTSGVLRHLLRTQRGDGSANGVIEGDALDSYRPPLLSFGSRAFSF